MLTDRESAQRETLRAYQWVSSDRDGSFDEDLRILRSNARAMAVGIVVPVLGTWILKTVIGNARLVTSRIEALCEKTLDCEHGFKTPGFAGTPLRSPDGVVFAVLFCIDPKASPQLLPLLARCARQIVTNLELRRLNAALEEKNEELRERQRGLSETKRLHRDFLSHLSHEMRTPLHAILGLTELLQDEAHRPHLDKLLHNLSHSAHNMLETLNVLLEHSKLESQAIRLQPVKIELRKFLDETLEPFESLVIGRGLDFHKNVTLQDDAHCHLDKVRLRQVINNLVGNAIKFTETGSITVALEIHAPTAAGEASWITLKVTDTGLGIHRFNHNLLFEPYRQVSGDSSKGGSGLGLSICKKIIESMDGQIGLESEYGEGSTFWFRIPVRFSDEQSEVLPSGEGFSDSEDCRSGRILIIEDNPITRTVTSKILESKGYTVHIASRFSEVSRELAVEDFDLIFMDLHLGELPPETLMQLVRSQSAAPLVLISGSPSPPVGLPADSALQKPYTRDALLESAKAWIYSERQVEELNYSLSRALEALEESVGSEFVEQTVTTFVARHPGDIDKLQRYLDEGNWAKLELTAHSMKSTLATLGLMDLSRLMTDMEAAAPSQDKGRLLSLLEHYRIDARRTYPQLLRYGKKTRTHGRHEIAS